MDSSIIGIVCGLLEQNHEAVSEYSVRGVAPGPHYDDALRMRKLDMRAKKSVRIFSRRGLIRVWALKAPHESQARGYRRMEPRVYFRICICREQFCRRLDLLLKLPFRIRKRVFGDGYRPLGVGSRQTVNQLQLVSRDVGNEAAGISKLAIG